MFWVYCRPPVSTNCYVSSTAEAYYILASLSFSRMKTKIWTPKITNAVAKAVTKATKLIPCEPWADPVVAEVVSAGAEEVVDMVGD